MRLFLDTNVVIDYAVATRPDHTAAHDAMRFCLQRGDTLILATSQVTDCYYILHKHLGQQETRTWLSKLLRLCELVPTSPNACVTALASPLPDFEDAVQVETAREARCDYILTRNQRDYATSPLPFIDPAGLLTLMRERERTPPAERSER